MLLDGQVADSLEASLERGHPYLGGTGLESRDQTIGDGRDCLVGG